MAGIACGQPAAAEAWRFALIGDTPYSASERASIPTLFSTIARAKPAFIVHVGDFKLSSARCTDALFADRKSLFSSSPVPFIFTPGDNEWTDCRDLAAGGYDSLERLAHLRTLFFAEPASLGLQRLTTERQSAAYPEHQRWRHGKVLFLTLNVPGPDNNYGIGKAPTPEFLARNPQVIDWVRQGFALARKDGLKGVVIAMQASPDFGHYAAGVGDAGFRALLDVLRTETMAFSGSVLLLHGDTHWQRTDHPLRRPGDTSRLQNFTRVESFGYPFMGWVQIDVHEDDDAATRFRVTAHRCCGARFFGY